WPLPLEARAQIVRLSGPVLYGKSQLEHHAILGIRVSEHLPEHAARARRQCEGIGLAEDAECGTQSAARESLRNPIVFQCEFRSKDPRGSHGPTEPDVSRGKGTCFDSCP